VRAQRDRPNFDLADNESMNETDTMSYLQTSRRYTMRTMEKPNEKELYHTRILPLDSQHEDGKTSTRLDLPSNLDTPIQSDTIELKKVKIPKLYKELNKLDELYDKFEIDFQEI
jgi:hypothetical protein